MDQFMSFSQFEQASFSLVEIGNANLNHSLPESATSNQDYKYHTWEGISSNLHWSSLMYAHLIIFMEFAQYKWLNYYYPNCANMSTCMWKCLRLQWSLSRWTWFCDCSSSTYLLRNQQKTRNSILLISPKCLSSATHDYFDFPKTKFSRIEWHKSVRSEFCANTSLQLLVQRS